jgi:hypothetical protein
MLSTIAEIIRDLLIFVGVIAALLIALAVVVSRMQNSNPLLVTESDCVSAGEEWISRYVNMRMQSDLLHLLIEESTVEGAKSASAWQEWAHKCIQRPLPHELYQSSH